MPESWGKSRRKKVEEEEKEEWKEFRGYRSLRVALTFQNRTTLLGVGGVQRKYLDVCVRKLHTLIAGREWIHVVHTKNVFIVVVLYDALPKKYSRDLRVERR